MFLVFFSYKFVKIYEGQWYRDGSHPIDDQYLGARVVALYVTNGRQQCDQIWKFFASFVKIKKSLATFKCFWHLAKFETYFGKHFYANRANCHCC